MSDREQYVRDVCKMGQGAECCRYLTMGADGWSCEKGSALQFVIDGKVKDGSFTAQGDNCDGAFGVALPYVVLTEDYLGHLAGTKLYETSLYDYGCAADDTELLGEPCRSWSTLPSGGYPFVSVPLSKVSTPVSAEPGKVE